MVMSIFRILGLTGLLRLVTKLLLDRRVPLRLKLLIPAALVYLVSPIDPLPDFLPILGHVDDLIVTVVALAIFLAMAPREVVLEHFRGRRDDEPRRDVNVIVHPPALQTTQVDQSEFRTVLTGSTSPFS